VKLRHQPNIQNCSPCIGCETKGSLRFRPEEGSKLLRNVGNISKFQFDATPKRSLKNQRGKYITDQLLKFWHVHMIQRRNIRQLKYVALFWGS